jgi:GT2 family glycosyltransferase
VSTVTVVVPVHGAAPYLAEALASLAADDARVIVVQDGPASLPDLGDAEHLPLEHLGRSAARNAGVEAARSEYVAFLDADDVSHPGRLQRQCDALEASPASPLAYGGVAAIGNRSEALVDETDVEATRFKELLGRGATFEGLLVDCPIYTSATMVRREHFLAAGGYDPAIDAYEDLDLYLRLAQRGPLVPTAGAVVASHRRHGANTPSSALYEGSLLLVEKHLATASGPARSLLLERRVDALWGLGRFDEARRAALTAVRAAPSLLLHRRFAKRLAAAALPGAVLRARRRAT